RSLPRLHGDAGAETGIDPAAAAPIELNDRTNATWKPETIARPSDLEFRRNPECPIWVRAAGSERVPKMISRACDPGRGIAVPREYGVSTPRRCHRYRRWCAPLSGFDNRRAPTSRVSILLPPATTGFPY